MTTEEQLVPVEAIREIDWDLEEKHLNDGNGGGGFNNNNDRGCGGNGDSSGEDSEWGEFSSPYDRFIGATIGFVVGVTVGMMVVEQRNPSFSPERRKGVRGVGSVIAQEIGPVAVISAIGAVTGHKIQKEIFPPVLK